jgi:hypothetical protein
MNLALGTRTFFPRFVLMVGLTGAAALPAFAEVYKCKNSDGSPVFQEKPCGSPEGVFNAPDRPAAPGKSGGKAKPADAANKAMNEAFQSRMDKKDYDGALAFATTEKQKALARKMAEEKRIKCESLAAKYKLARAEFKNNGAKWKPKADAAEAEYANHCR